ncbi:MerR family transcriptional regulator [Peribacillus sp. NPDC096540]|uniref:MerR family transcriptional regulator n=1 Tax=Peribacillus sp. NPDC096540 TaxID=3390612 RepID=UPI003CFBF567
MDYYTQIGLLDPIRKDSNYRLYGEECIQILDLVEHYKTLNMPVKEVKNFLTYITLKVQLTRKE